MKLLMTLLVRDEADIISANLDFHLHQGVDTVIAMDNLSVDGATEILRAYERRGVLHYIHQPNDDYAQSSWVTHMARLACAEFGADWVINGARGPGTVDARLPTIARRRSCERRGGSAATG